MMNNVDPIDQSQTENNKLTEVSSQLLKGLITRNAYENNDEYSINHPNAMANGDERGRGTGNFMDVNNLNAGTSIDIHERSTQKAINHYGSGNEYPDF